MVGLLKEICLDSQYSNGRRMVLACGNSCCIVSHFSCFMGRCRLGFDMLYFASISYPALAQLHVNDSEQGTTTSKPYMSKFGINDNNRLIVCSYCCRARSQVQSCQSIPLFHILIAYAPPSRLGLLSNG